jgi:hypothetical protein
MILQPPQVSDVFTPLRQRDLVDGLNNAGNISGDGVETLPTGRGVGIISRRPALAQRLVIVRIMSPAAGGGKYIGRIMNLPDDDVTEDGNLVEAAEFNKVRGKIKELGTKGQHRAQEDLMTRVLGVAFK